MNTSNHNSTTPVHSAGPHLSEDALDEILMGIESPEDAAHLRACPHCQSRAAAFQSPVALFNQAATSWADARSSSLPRLQTSHRPVFRLTHAHVWSTATAAFLLVAFGLGNRLASHEAVPSVSHATPVHATDTSHAPHSQSELAEDNAMLAAIDSAIDSPEPAQFMLYDTTHSSARHHEPSRQAHN